MNWLTVAVTSYLINAGVYVGDKFLLSKKIHSSIVYAFYVGIWSIFNFVLLIFDFWVPNLEQLTIDLLAGFLFLLTLIFWYKALHQSEATRVVPIVGALTPIFSFILSFAFFGESLNERQVLSFLILICGGILISVKQTRLYVAKEVVDSLKSKFGNIFGGIHASYRPTGRLIVNSVISAAMFASYYVLIKSIYNNQPFVGGFVWSRLGSFLGVLMILLVPSWRKLIVSYQKHTKSPGNISFFLAVRVLAALAFVMLNWSISMGNVALINALQGVQYVFLIVLVLFLSRKYPKILQEEFYGGVFLQKIMGVVLISIGLYMLVTLHR